MDHLDYYTSVPPIPTGIPCPLLRDDPFSRDDHNLWALDEGYLICWMQDRIFLFRLSQPIIAKREGTLPGWSPIEGNKPPIWIWASEGERLEYRSFYSYSETLALARFDAEAHREELRYAQHVHHLSAE